MKKLYVLKDEKTGKYWNGATASYRSGGWGERPRIFKTVSALATSFHGKIPHIWIEEYKKKNPCPVDDMPENLNYWEWQKLIGDAAYKSYYIWRNAMHKAWDTHVKTAKLKSEDILMMFESQGIVLYSMNDNFGCALEKHE